MRATTQLVVCDGVPCVIDACTDSRSQLRHHIAHTVDCPGVGGSTRKPSDSASSIMR